MHTVMPPPLSAIEPVTDVFHGVPITDPYRWLEDQNSPETRAWIEEQTQYARAYLDSIPSRGRIRERVRELLDVETYDSFLKCGNRYFFRKRLPGQEQPCIYFREGPGGEDQLLVDPAARGTGLYTAVKPLRASHDGSLLLYEVKHGGERMGMFEILDLTTGRVLPDSLPHGYLRGFAFSPDGKGFYYVHEAAEGKRPFYRAAYQHTLGTKFDTDREIFCAGEEDKLRLILISSSKTLGFLIYHFLEKTRTDFFIWGMGSTGRAVPVLRDADYSFDPRLVPGRIFAIIDENAPNRRIVDVEPRKHQNPLYFNLVPETDVPLGAWAATANHIVAVYTRRTRTEIRVFDRFGTYVGAIPTDNNDTVRVISSSIDDDELLLECQSFARPIEILRCAIPSGLISTWARRSVSIRTSDYQSIETAYPSKDGTQVPMFLVGRHDVLARGCSPTVMTSYGGFGKSMTPQFSVFVAFLMERGCLFALPNIRGGSEFGADWHNAAKGRNRQTAFDDFVCGAEWLVASGHTAPVKLAIFGGSNSGLLVGAALTQRPDLFRAAVCMVPMLDMLRYHLFDGAHVWKDEFGTVDDPQDFAALAKYSPYHKVRDGVAYPATMIVSGGADRNCNPLHARKMTARLQAANISKRPIFLDYHEFRGHSPVLPLSTRIDALADRMAFLCDQLGISI
jgi:prolyl oligopeptidase